MYTTLNAGSSEGSEDDESMRDDSAAPDRVIFCADIRFFCIETSIYRRLTYLFDIRAETVSLGYTAHGLTLCLYLTF